MSRFPNCSVKDCGSVALWHPVILIWEIDQKPHEHDPVRVKLQTKICGICKGGFGLKDLIDDDWFDRIQNLNRALNRHDLDKSTIKLDWISIEGKR